MASVTIIVKETKQPRGGFIRPSSLVKTPGQSDKIMVADISTNPYRPWTPADENDESIKYLYAYDEDKGTTVLYDAFFDVFAATSDFQCRNEKQ